MPHTLMCKVQSIKRGWHASSVPYLTQLSIQMLIFPGGKNNFSSGSGNVKAEALWSQFSPGLISLNLSPGQ